MAATAPAPSDDTLEVRLDWQRGDFRLQLDVRLPAHGVTALFGPSGSGKTTILRAIAGLQQVPGARVVVGQTVWQDAASGVFVPVHRRALGYVFQEASLFAHLSVRDNLHYGWQRKAPGERRLHWEQITDWLGLDSLLTRPVAGLSGGERQRVAIGRALLSSPRLLLMDEPLAALDRAGRHSILPYLERLHEQLDVPVLYVSHALDEVARLADHLVVLEEGHVRACGPLGELLARPELLPDFADEPGTVVEGTVGELDAEFGLCRLQFAGGGLWAAGRHQTPGRRLRARILARDVSVAVSEPGPSSILNVLRARVDVVVPFDQDRVCVRLLCEDAAGVTPLLSLITRRSSVLLDLRPGQPVFAQVKSVALLT